MRTKQILSVLVVSVVGSSVLFFSGCKTPPAKDSGFLKNADKMKSKEVLPAHRVWKAPNTNINDYDKVLVKPVFTKKQLELGMMEKMNVHSWQTNTWSNQ